MAELTEGADIERGSIPWKTRRQSSNVWIWLRRLIKRGED